MIAEGNTDYNYKVDEMSGIAHLFFHPLFLRIPRGMPCHDGVHQRFVWLVPVTLGDG